MFFLGGETLDKMHEIYKPILSQANCHTYLPNDFDQLSMLCAGYDQGGTDACAVRIN